MPMHLCPVAHCGIHACRPPRRLDDPKLCKHFLMGFCPAEEFQRTKHDYGTCTQDHDEEAKAQVGYSFPYEGQLVSQASRWKD